MLPVYQIKWCHTPGYLSSPFEPQIFFHTFYCLISKFPDNDKRIFSLWRVLFMISCMLVEIHWCFRRIYCLHLKGKIVIKPTKQHTWHLLLAGCLLLTLKVEALHSSEILMYFYQTWQHHIPGYITVILIALRTKNPTILQRFFLDHCRLPTDEYPNWLLE